MANLIITIISIALVAVAALMGAYYGGSAFLQGQGKAYANALISQGEQLVAAWSIYAADRGGSWTLSDLNTLSQSSVTPAYITSIPNPPASVTSSTAISAWTVVNLSSIGSGTANGVYVRLTDDNSGNNVCLLVAQMTGGTSLSVPPRTSVATNITQNATSKFGCVFVNTSAAAMGTSDVKYVYYRAY